MYRKHGTTIQVLLVHFGGPLWAKKDVGAWAIPKGEYQAPEAPLDAAIREFAEETGVIPEEPFLPLGIVTQAGGKTVAAWAFQGDCDATQLRSNTFTMEWPRKSGILREFPEVDQAQWFDLDTARAKILRSQASFLDALLDVVQRDTRVT